MIRVDLVEPTKSFSHTVPTIIQFLTRSRGKLLWLLGDSTAVPCGRRFLQHGTCARRGCRYVSGLRVVAPASVKSVAGISFQGYGSHHSSYTHAYFTAAAALVRGWDDMACAEALGAVCSGCYQERYCWRLCEATAVCDGLRSCISWI